MQLKIAASILLGATSLVAQCNTQDVEIRTFNPWSASFYYASNNGETLNQFLDLTVSAPVTVNQMFSTSYNQFPAGGTTPLDQVGNVAEVRLYTIAGTHIGNEQLPASWTQVASAEMTIVAWNGDCVIQNFKDPAGVPTPFVLPTGTYGFCIEYIPTSWAGTASLPQTNVPLLNPGSLSCLGVDPGANFPTLLVEDQFIAISAGGIQTRGWQVVDAAGALGPFATPNAAFTDQPNLAFDYSADPAAGRSESIGPGCYNLPFMLYEQFPANTTPVDLANTNYTAVKTASANGGFYTITNGGIPYIAPPIGAPGLIDLTQGGTAVAPIANSSGNLDDCTFAYTMQVPLAIPSPGGGLLATELGINSNGKIYFDTAAPTDTSFLFNGANYGGITGFRDLAAQWAIWYTDLDPSTGGDIYVMEPSPNLGGLMVWWDNVPNWPPVAGVTCSMSIEFTPDGSVCNIAYGANLACDGGGNDAIVGFSAGNGEPVGVEIDWSAIPSAPNAQVSGDGSSAPTLEIGTRPVEMTSTDLILGNLPAPAAPGIPRLGLFILSTAPAPFAIDLGVIGMPGCPFYLGGSPLILTGVENPAALGDIRLPFPIPGNTAGFDLYVQAAALHAVLPPNALGLTVSNAACLTIGTF